MDLCCFFPATILLFFWVRVQQNQHFLVFQTTRHARPSFNPLLGSTHVSWPGVSCNGRMVSLMKSAWEDWFRNRDAIYFVFPIVSCCRNGVQSPLYWFSMIYWRGFCFPTILLLVQKRDEGNRNRQNVFSCINWRRPGWSYTPINSNGQEISGWWWMLDNVCWFTILLLMAEILHHLGCMKPYK